jgi:Uncharacterized protein conserved in bacteria
VFVICLDDFPRGITGSGAGRNPITIDKRSRRGAAGHGGGAAPSGQGAPDAPPRGRGALGGPE